MTLSTKTVWLLCAAALPLAPGYAIADDEIQVYDGEVRAQGRSGVEIHMNWTPDGLQSASWPGQIPTRRAFNITPEISWGLGGGSDWGLYLPTTEASGAGWQSDGTKIRIKRIFSAEPGQPYWGANFELARNRKTVAQQAWTGELRTIAGMVSGPWEVVGNLSLGFDLSGPERKGSPELGVSARVVRKISDSWSLGAEHYAGCGPLNDLLTWQQSSQSSFGIVEYDSGSGWAIHMGIGHGWTDGAERTMFKSIVSIDF
jgi:hypothetical protein